MLSDRCLSCLSLLSATLVYCGQTVGWIKMKLGTQVGLGRGHIVLVGDPTARPPKGHSSPQFSAHICCGQMAGWIKMPLGRELGLGPSDIVLDGDQLPSPQNGTQPPIFGPCLLWPNNWIDQDATWYVGSPQPRPHCSRWGPSSPPHLTPPKKCVTAPIFSPCLLWPNGLMDQDDTWYGDRPQHRPHCFIGDRAPPQNGTAPYFLAHVYCGQTAGWIKMPLATKVGLGLGNVVLNVDPAPPPKGHSPPIFGHVCCGQTVAYLSYC